MGTPSAQRVVVACAADSRYALPLAVTLRSLETNLDPGRGVEVYAADDGILADDKSKILASLSERTTLHWVQAPALESAGLPTWGRMPLTTYRKLTVDRWLPQEVDKALWMDADLLVLGDVARLWEIDLGNRHAMAVPDQRVPTVSSCFGVAAWRALGLAAGAKYFNAGVMLIDVARWRREDVAGRAMDYLKTYRDRVSFWDQEALNAVLAGRWGELDSRWNWSPGIDHLVRREAERAGRHVARVSVESAWIIHFSGNLKPWAYAGSGPQDELYRCYLDQTAWSGRRPARNWRGRVLRAYESSPARRFLYPLEQLGTRIVMALTRR